MKTLFAMALSLAPLVATPALAEIRTVAVTAEMAETARLPDSAVIAIELLDVSKADAPSVTLSMQMLTIKGLPVAVELPYESELIDDRMSYAVAARIVSGDTVLARTTTSYPVITRGAGNSVEVTLEPMQMAASSSEIETGVTWTAFEIGGRMLVLDTPPTLTVMPEGTFSVFGGCNQFTGQADMSDGNFTVTGPMAGTRKMCPEPVMKLEQDVVDAMTGAKGFVVSGNNLTLVNAAGVPVIRFQKAG